MFTELIETIGVKNAQVEELISLDDEFLFKIQPIFGLIFCFKITEKFKQREVLDQYDPELFYAEQVINNACATQAILSILMNCPKVELGNELSNLKEFSMGMSAKDIGYSIGNSDVIREAHNSFSRQEPFEVEERRATKDDDVFHFIAYVPFNGKLYELDGCQGGPILIADVDEETWLPIAREEINNRIASYESQEMRFNLLAVCPNLLQKHDSELLSTQLKIQHLAKELGDAYEEVAGELSADELAQLPTDRDQMKQTLGSLQSQLLEIQELRNEEAEKREKWKKDNQRRRHNYVPLVLEMLKIMAEKNMIGDLYKEAEEKHKKRLEEKAKEKQDAAKA